jgi:hypothetical protein
MTGMSEQEPVQTDEAEQDGRRPDRRRSAAAERRRARVAAIIAATRSLLDARGVREDAPGVPAVVPVGAEQVTDTLVEALMALARAR